MIQLYGDLNINILGDNVLVSNGVGISTPSELKISLKKLANKQILISPELIELKNQNFLSLEELKFKETIHGERRIFRITLAAFITSFILGIVGVIPSWIDALNKNPNRVQITPESRIQTIHCETNSNADIGAGVSP